MTALLQGGCRCGVARYEVDLSNSFTLNCHCIDCQKHLGAPYSVFTIVQANQFKWLSKPNGNIAFSDLATRSFCDKCGTYLKWEGKNESDKAEFNAMTLDNSIEVTVDAEIFTRSRLNWIKALDNVPQYEAGRNIPASKPV
ncbi:GFA family protein [Kordiimonas aquimaris]|uniref:GFA family protein n=1 Tax=Kordiimonas aquimaris TaxID=707591 RepID=UPI0021CFEF88|nr:GFA family protein [Kordiimonas aquimaris]